MSLSISRRFIKRMTGLFIGVLLLAATGVIALIWIGSSKLITPHRRALEPRHYELIAQPAEYGLDLEPFIVTTHDGIALSAILATRAKTPGVAEKTRRMAARLGHDFDIAAMRPIGTVVFLHGRSGCKEDMLSLAQRFVAADYRCLVYDARAHGMSGGSVCTFGHNETHDLSAVIDQVSGLLKARGENPGQICAVGNSLGASVILQALPSETRIDVAVAVSPFASLSEVVIRSAKNTFSPHTPEWLIVASMWAGGQRAEFDPFTVSPFRAVRVTTTPVFFTHGALDKVIPVSHSEQLYAAAPEPKRLRVVPNGYHYNILAEGGDALYQEMIEFCLDLIP